MEGGALAEELLSSPWQISADRFTSYMDSEDIIAEGNVILQRQKEPGVKPLEIKADWIKYDRKNGSISARGNLFLRSEDQEITAQEAFIDLEKQTGNLKSTTFFFEEDNLYFSGKEVEKSGELTYHFEDGWITACRVEPGKKFPWSFKSADVRMTVDSYAFLKHTTFRIKDVPVLYTPYLIFPVKTKRESGFLFPELSHSDRDGLGFIAPLFVNLSPSYDATLYPGYLEKKGEFLGLEFRYVNDFESKGTFAVNYLHDTTSDTINDDFRSDGFLRDQHDRYWLRGKADHEISENLQAKLDVDLVSDRDYLQEYRAGMTGFAQNNADFVENFSRGFQEESIPFRESTLQLVSTRDTTILSGELRGVDDNEDTVSPETAVHALPRILWNSHPMLFKTPITLDWGAEYVNYWREEGLGYHRVDLNPRLTTRLPLGSLFEGRMSGVARETLYRVESYSDANQEYWQDPQDKNRTAFEFRTNTAMVLTRDYDFDLKTLDWLNHTFRPNIEYLYVDTEDQSDLPQLDADDLIEEKNLVTYELNNYFKAGSAATENGPSARYLGYFKTSQSYNINEDRPFTDINFDLLLYPLQELYVRYRTRLSVYGERVPQYDFETRYTKKDGNSVAMDYNYLRGSRRDLKFSAKVKVLDEFTIKAETTRSLITDRTVYESIGIQYSPHCWAVEIAFAQDADDTKVMVLFSLSGLGKSFEMGKSGF